MQQKTCNMGEYNIKVVLLDEALAFVRSLPIKVQEKIVYNYKKIENGLMSKGFSRNWTILRYGSSERFITAIAIGCFPFGTLRQIPLLLPLMAL